ncbi:MAG TPA: YIP1 family protein [Bacteroidota bacterium]|nr:YIP1 family protein [Bacteroidota bacterium]
MNTLRELIIRPQDFFERRQSRPTFLRYAVFTIVAQTAVAVFCVLMSDKTLNAWAIIGTIFLAGTILTTKLTAAVLFLYLAVLVLGTRSKNLYRTCASITVHAWTPLLLGRLCAAICGFIIYCERGSDFSSITFVNVNAFLAAFHLPVFLMFEKADIFAAWFIIVFSLGIRISFSLNKIMAAIIAAADWIFVAALQESIFQYFKSSFYG